MKNNSAYEFSSENLKKVLKKNGMSHHILARVLGVAESTVGHWCNGFRNPSEKYIVSLCRLFALPRDYFVKEKTVEAIPKAVTPAVANEEKVFELIHKMSREITTLEEYVANLEKRIMQTESNVGKIKVAALEIIRDEEE